MLRAYRFSGYKKSDILKDLLSGITVGIVAIPLGMAFAIASGVKPEYGIYTTIVAGILISLAGGSRFQIGGPTGAFIPVLFAIIAQYGYEDLLVAGLMAGVLLFIMGCIKMGALITYIPRPVTIGFTSGIAVIIFCGQIPGFLGLAGIEKHEAFHKNIMEILSHLATVNLFSLITSLVCLAVILILPRFIPGFPTLLAGLLISTVLASLLYPGKIETIGSVYGGIPSHLPSFHLPAITWGTVEHLWRPAFVIAMLGGIESLLSAVVADGATGHRHNSNRELMGQGVANVVTSFFGGIPATGAIARTMTNIKSGAVSPLSGIFHGIFVLVTLLILAPYAAYIPLASMAPILMVVAWNMSERKHFLHILRTKTTDSLVLMITFLLTVFFTLTVAVEVGLLLAMILFIKRMSSLLQVEKTLPDHMDKSSKMTPAAVQPGHDCPQFSIYTIEGPVFFGAAHLFEKTLSQAIHKMPRVLLLRMSRVPLIDTTGEADLAALVKDFQERKGIILISGMREQPLSILQRTGLYEKIGEEHFFTRTGEALTYGLTLLNHKECQSCHHFAFRECYSYGKKENRTGDRAVFETY
jgi:sulfate permease, SulP family